MTEENPELFRIKTTYSLEEFKRYNRSVFFSNKILSTVLMIFVVVLLALAVIQKNYLFAIVAFFYPGFVYFLRMRVVNRAYQVNLKNDEKVEIIFSARSVKQIVDKKAEVVDYDQVTRVIETPTNFYIMYGKNQGIIIVKRNLKAPMYDTIYELKANVNEKSGKKKAGKLA
jgi:hypothetical protein